MKVTKVETTVRVLVVAHALRTRSMACVARMMGISRARVVTARAHWLRTLRYARTLARATESCVIITAGVYAPAYVPEAIVWPSGDVDWTD